ncbi:MAG TPA: hypothetical protein VJ753_06210, partial [Rhizomicrobium sp.]|nr:hypothetical protein [Rhizomicrobium sp.]
MTDKPAHPLNLIERMAQRLEKESAATGANVVGRAMERDLSDGASAPTAYGAQGAPLRDQVQAQAPALRRDGVTMVGPGDDSVRVPAASAVKAAPSPMRPNTPSLPGKTVRLDFR